MLQAYLDRIQKFDRQTLGVLKLYSDGVLLFECKTLELPWKNNEKNISCIEPAPTETQTYDCIVIDSSPSFNYKHIWITGVNNRTGIKIHIGNFFTQIKGCVLVGEDYYDLNGDGLLDITNSKATLAKLVELMSDGCKLHIRWVEIE